VVSGSNPPRRPSSSAVSGWSVKANLLNLRLADWRTAWQIESENDDGTIGRRPPECGSLEEGIKRDALLSAPESAHQQ
jgi:hypothetical protein